MSPAEALRRALDRLNFAIGRGKVNLVDDTGPVQRHQVDVGPIGPEGSRGIHDNTPAIHHFGFTSVPPEGADVIVLFVGGRRSSAVAIGTNHQPSRLKGLSPGDSAVFDVRGAYLKFTAGGLEVDAAGLPVTVGNAQSVTVTTAGAAKIVCNTAEVDAPGGVSVNTSGAGVVIT